MGCLALWQISGCRRGSVTTPAVAIRQEISPWPARVGAATVTFSMSDPHGQAIQGARIALEADMSHPGMRPEFGEAREIGAGHYQGRLTFTMPGDWVVLLHITLRGGQTFDRQMEVKGVRAK